MNRIRSDASSPFVRHPLWKAYSSQMHHAKRRGIAFRLTFEQWLSIWEASGHLRRRGKQDGQYVMARPGDCGPYAVGNVRIVTINQNGHESKGKTGQVTPPECREKIRLAHQGLSPLSEASVREIKRRYVRGSRNANTVTLAQEYGVCQYTVWAIVNGLSWKQVRA